MTRLSALRAALSRLWCSLRLHRMTESRHALRCETCHPVRERTRVVNVDPRQVTIEEVGA